MLRGLHHGLIVSFRLLNVPNPAGNTSSPVILGLNEWTKVATEKPRPQFLAARALSTPHVPDLCRMRLILGNVGNRAPFTLEAQFTQDTRFSRGRIVWMLFRTIGAEYC